MPATARFERQQSLYCNGILWFGTEAQKREWITPVASGDEIGAYSLTEPMSGSDAGNMASRAVLNQAGTHFIINGRKSWVTSAPVARSHRIVYYDRRRRETARHYGVSDQYQLSRFQPWQNRTQARDSRQRHQRDHLR